MFLLGRDKEAIRNIAAYQSPRSRFLSANGKKEISPF